jgi:hypothetical protein
MLLNDYCFLRDNEIKYICLPALGFLEVALVDLVILCKTSDALHNKQEG